jgi:hypothetical protein
LNFSRRWCHAAMVMLLYQFSVQLFPPDNYRVVITGFAGCRNFHFKGWNFRGFFNIWKCCALAIFAPTCSNVCHFPKHKWYLKCKTIRIPKTSRVTLYINLRQTQSKQRELKLSGELFQDIGRHDRQSFYFILLFFFFY